MQIQLKGLFLLVLICGQHIQPTLAENKEEFEFQAEIGRLMDIIINSLYTHKEIFLRELISNASDALDKIRFLAIQDPDILGETNELQITIDYDKEAKTVSIIDTGVGMTKNDLIQNLGTIAKSGTINFIEAIKAGNMNIIGQFGVGFYSSFLVAQHVTVTSKHNDDDQWIWESSAANSFTLIKDSEGNTLGRGTKVTIHLKQDAEEFVEEKTLGSLIKKYSEFINFPIKLKTIRDVSKEVTDSEDDGEDKKEEPKEKDGEAPKKKTKVITEKVVEFNVQNDNKAIWTKSKEDIKDEDYLKFYKSFSKDYDDPMTWIHFRAEGEVDFTSLLYIGKKAAHDQFENYNGPSNNIKLYVRRVLINEEFEDLMPRYLNFIKGVVDSDELPINVSRESIQQLKMLKVIERKLVRKALEMIRKLADDQDESEEEEEGSTEEETESEQEEIPKEEEEVDEEAQKKKNAKKDKYKNFWKEFGKNIKLGIIEDSSNRQKLAKISRWYSTKSLEDLTSFDAYIERAKPGQDNIYFIAGESKEQLMTHPTIQKLLKKGYEVLLLDDPIDEFTFQHLTDYEKKKFTNVGKGDFKFPEDDDVERQKFKKLKKMYKPLTDWWKKLISEELDEVRLSQRLVDDPVVVVGTEYSYSANMERISKAQAYANTDRANPYANSKKILEINPSHPAIKELFERVKDDPDKETEDLAIILFQGAVVNSGYSLKEPASFSKKFYRLFNGALGIPKDAPCEEVEVDLDDSGDEAETKSNTPQVEQEDLDEKVDPADDTREDL